MQQKYQITIIADADYDEQKIKHSLEMFKYNIVKIKKVANRRSLSQNSALHKWLDTIAEETKNKGLTLQALYKEPSDIPVTKEILKQFAKQTVDHITGGKHDSTSKLDTKQFSTLVEVLIKIFGERLDNQIPFPSIDELLNKQR